MSIGGEFLPGWVGFTFFALSIPFFYWKMRSGETSFGDFSVGVSLSDVYSVLLIMVPLTACMSYLVMGLGFGIVTVEGARVFWIRYFEWGVSTPLLVMGVMVLTQNSKHSLRAMISDFLMIVTGFIGTITTGILRYLFFTGSMVFFGYVVYLMVSVVSEDALNRPKTIRKLFLKLRNWTVGLWSLYPLVWILSSRELELLNFYYTNVFFTILDIAAKIGFSWIVITSLGGTSEIDVGMDFD